MMCDIPKCNAEPTVKAVFEESEQYNLCAEHLEYKDDRGVKIFKDYAKQIISICD